MMAHDLERFVGAWTLEEWRIDYEDGRSTRPFGDRPAGYLIYSACGVMSASVARSERGRFNQPNARNASYEEKAGAFDSYFHYAGTWRVDGDTVAHAVEMGLNPDMAGTEQRRKATFLDEGARLQLSADEPAAGGVRRHVLLWKRTEPDA